MPCIAIGPEEEEEGFQEQQATAAPWSTSCQLTSAETVTENADTTRESDVQRSDEETAGVSTASPWRNKYVVFLEIDGILNTRPEPRMISVQKVQCMQLRRLLDASDAEVVLTSSWRRHHEYVAEVLKNFGALPENRKEVFRAPWNANSERRDLEILQWVNAHRDIAGWVALDARDLLRFPSAPRLDGHTIQVNPIEGLTSENVEAALRLLGCRPGSKDASSESNPEPTTQSPKQAVGLITPGAYPLSVPSSVSISAEDFPAAKSRASGTDGSSKRSLQAVDASLADTMRSALSWDSDLAGKMEALLGSLPPVADSGDAAAASTEGLFPKSDASRAEFQAVLAAAREKFTEVPDK